MFSPSSQRSTARVGRARKQTSSPAFAGTTREICFRHHRDDQRPRGYTRYFSPVLEAVPMVGPGTLVMGAPELALRHFVMMTDERMSYLAERWWYRAEQERRKRGDPSSFYPRVRGRG